MYRLNRLEMAQKLFENPKLKAEDTDCNDSTVGVRKSTEPHVIGNEIYNIKHGFTLKLSDGINETWKIIEPPKKLKEFTIAEVLYIYANTTLREDGCVSLVTGKNYARGFNGMRLDELKGKWTIEGYYED